MASEVRAAGGTASRHSETFAKEAEECFEEMEKLNAGYMSEYPKENPQTIKDRLHNMMLHWRFEVFIVVLIVTDLLVTLIEMGLEYRFICVTPELLPIPRENIKGMLVQQHGAAFSSYDLDDSSNVSLSYSSIWPTFQNEAIKGAMMLQIGTSSIAKIVGKVRQPEHIGEGHSDSHEGAPEQHGHEGHEHRYGHKTLVCEGPHGRRSHKLHTYCHVLGLLILSTFILELTLKAWIDISRFIRSKLQLLDLCIVTISFLLDFLWPIFERRHPDLMETNSDTIKVIILFTRLIRVVKVMHATSEVLHKGVHYVKEQAHKIQEKEDHIQEQDEEIKRLKEELKIAQGGKPQK